MYPQRQQGASGVRISISHLRRAAATAATITIVAAAVVPQVASMRENPFVNAGTQLGTVATGAGQSGSVQEGALEDIIGKLIKGAISFVGVFFFGYLVWAGYLWMTAHGEEEKISQAKKMISGGVIGLAITLAAYAITTFIIMRLERAGAG